jgi:23S rRNA (pseudouridine1915-N3)-methyltransferase
MHIHLWTSGRIKPIALQKLADEYLRRLPSSWHVKCNYYKKISEINCKGWVGVCDEKGTACTSIVFAQSLIKNATYHHQVNFLIGPPDGWQTPYPFLYNEVISLSSFTFTHNIAAIILCEQLYRASTILSGHPYHRE